MNSFQVEQFTSTLARRKRFFRFSLSALLFCLLALFGSVLGLSSPSGTLTSFAQNLPKPRQVLGASSNEPHCEGVAYALPTAVKLNASKGGLHYTEEAPQFYTIYGSSLGELRQAITDCEVRKQSGNYHASTTYTLNWQYSVQASNGQCSLHNVAVGLATNQYFPRLAANQPLPTNDQTAWESYYSSLVSHENEHLALNKKYAADMLNSLTHLSASCDSIEVHAKTVTKSYVELLNSANDLLDSKTNHGADTGAVL